MALEGEGTRNAAARPAQGVLRQGARSARVSPCRTSKQPPQPSGALPHRGPWRNTPSCCPSVLAGGLSRPSGGDHGRRPVSRGRSRCLVPTCTCQFNRRWHRGTGCGSGCRTDQPRFSARRWSTLGLHWVPRPGWGEQRLSASKVFFLMVSPCCFPCPLRGCRPAPSFSRRR